MGEGVQEEGGVEGEMGVVDAVAELSRRRCGLILSMVPDRCRYRGLLSTERASFPRTLSPCIGTESPREPPEMADWRDGFWRQRYAQIPKQR